jgi:hypothetical protein
MNEKDKELVVAQNGSSFPSLFLISLMVGNGSAAKGGMVSGDGDEVHRLCIYN